MSDTRRRVKVYTGTGHVSSTFVERLKGISLLVRAESDGSLLLESKISPNTAYQKQQDTLIVWSEADNYDLALSFQEKAGCDEIWEKICQICFYSEIVHLIMILALLHQCHRCYLSFEPKFIEKQCVYEIYSFYFKKKLSAGRLRNGFRAEQFK
uniref:PP4R3 EVH1-like domain-containing protein n=1 Tax=Sphaeramia orbicularis TaxID=375764 RepID=A0A672ZGP6_9TELE